MPSEWRICFHRAIVRQGRKTLASLIVSACKRFSCREFSNECADALYYIFSRSALYCDLCRNRNQFKSSLERVCHGLLPIRYGQSGQEVTLHKRTSVEVCEQSKHFSRIALSKGFFPCPRFSSTEIGREAFSAEFWLAKAFFSIVAN